MRWCHLEEGRSARRAMLRHLKKLLRARPNDAVRLAFLDAPQAGEIERLDLTLLSEFKRSASGVVELKFQDRLKAIELLDRLAGPGEDGAEQFFQALEQGADWEGRDGT